MGAAQSGGESFDLSPDTGPAKITITIGGEKGEGKTSTAMCFPGKIAVISLDRKSASIKDEYDLKNVDVYNGVKYWVEDSTGEDTITQGGAHTYRYIHALLNKFATENQYDWIVFDGLEILHQICEMTMRHKHKIGPVDGIANMNLWKERRMFLRALHNRALTAAKRGIVYTTYLEFVADVVENERTVAGKKRPKWVDVIMYETDITLYAYSQDDGSGRHYFVKVWQSKRHSLIQEAIRVEVTGPNYAPLFEKMKKGNQQKLKVEAPAKEIGMLAPKATVPPPAVDQTGSAENVELF
jgi:hypothetical protein